jgi:hypothetical protein
MLKTIRVAGFAAAAAFLCAANSAAAQDISADTQAAPAALAAETPVTPTATNPSSITPAPVLIATPAPAEAAALPAPVAEQSKADGVVTPGRGRPDRQEAVAAPAPTATPNAGIVANAGLRRGLDDLVAEHAGVEVNDEQFQCLASAVYFESRGEPLAGQLAVAEVILNRVKSGRFRDTICDVVKQPSQFSFVRRGVIPTPARQSSAWERAVAIAHIALNDLHDVTGEDSLFFHATYVNPGWGRQSRRIARIGNHIFYR